MLVVGLGPAGFNLAHHLMNDGHAVAAIDGLKIEPLPPEISGVEADGSRVPFMPVRDVTSLYEDLDDRLMAGFGGVAEYGILAVWAFFFLVIIDSVLMGARLNDMRPYEDGGATFAQAAFRWVLSNPNVDALVISMTERALIDEYLGASGATAVTARDVDLLRHAAQTAPDMPVAVITAYGNMDVATDAMKLGAYDFIAKPVALDRLRQLIEDGLGISRAEKAGDGGEEEGGPLGVLAELLQRDGHQRPLQLPRRLAAQHDAAGRMFVMISVWIAVIRIIG